MTHTRRHLQALLAEHGITPSRALGQNFVVDPNTVRRIARLAGVGSGSHVVEVGAGAGWLTLALAETGAEVTAVEVDRHVLPLLRSTIDDAGDAAARVRIVEGDAMALDWPALLAGEPAWTLVTNLPYNVATPLIIDLLDTASSITRMLVMVQREAGERLVAPPGSRVYGSRRYGSRIGRRPGSPAGSDPMCSCPGPGSSRCWSTSNAGRARGGATRTACSPWCGPGSGSGARCCAGRWATSSPPGRSRPPASRDRTRRGAVDRGLGPPDRRVRLVLRLVAFGRMLAFAKLTVSLRVTGSARTATT